MQRRAQFMAHVGEEGALGAARCLGRILGRTQFRRAGLDQALEMVAVGHQFKFGLLAQRDVARYRQMGNFASHVDGDCMGFHDAALAIEPDDGVLEHGLLAIEDPAMQFDKSIAIFWRDKIEYGLPGNLIKRRGLDHLQAGRVHLQQPPFGIQQLHAFRLVGDDFPEFFFAARQTGPVFFRSLQQPEHITAQQHGKHEETCCHRQCLVRFFPPACEVVIT